MGDDNFKTNIKHVLLMKLKYNFNNEYATIQYIF